MNWVPRSEDGRQPSERFVDRALLLMAVGFGEKYGRVDEFRLMKIPFTVQYRLNHDRVKSYSYRFYRDQHGPISKAIYQDRDVLRDAGLLEGTISSRRLTPLGVKLFAVLAKELRHQGENDNILETIKGRAKKVCRSDWDAIKKEVYSFPVRVPNMEEQTIEQAPVYTDVLFKLPTRSAKASIILPEAVSDALSLAFSMTPTSLEAASRDSGLTLEEAFAS